MTAQPAFFLFPPTLALLVLFAFTQGMRSDDSGYWVGVASSATVYMVFACGYAALAAALSAGRLRRSRLLRQAPARPTLQVVWASTWQVLTGAAVLQGVGLLLESHHTWGAPGRFPWELLPAWAAMIGFHAALGYGLGMILPMPAAAPLAVVVSYTWIGFAWSVPYVPLRYLSGLAIAGCCTVDAQLAPQAPIAATVFSTGAILAVSTVLTLRGRFGSRGILTMAGAALTVAVATSLSLAVAKGLGPYPSPQRTAADLSCTHTPVAQICLFPQQRWAPAADAVTVVSEALERLDAAGIHTPARVSATLRDTRPGTVDLIYRRDFDAATIVHSLSTSLTPTEREGHLCARDEKDPTTRLEVEAVTQTTLYRLATGTADALAQETPSAGTAVRDLLSLSPAARATWLNDAVRALDECDRPLPELPSARD